MVLYANQCPQGTVGQEITRHATLPIGQLGEVAPEKNKGFKLVRKDRIRKDSNIQKKICLTISYYLLILRNKKLKLNVETLSSLKFPDVPPKNVNSNSSSENR